MSSAEAGPVPEGTSPTGRPPSDGSTRDRIRDAAVLRFARSGFGTSVRTIAADAGVSPALVIHHFGSKDALHRACDDFVLRWIVAAKRQNMGRAAGGQLLQVMAEVDEFAPLLGYAVRSLQAGGEVARAFVQHMIDDAQVYTREAVADGIVKPSLDEDARVRYLVLSSLGTLLLSLTLDPPDDPEDFGANVRAFMTEQYLPMIELFTQGFLTSRRMLDDYLLYVGDPPAGTGTDPEPDHEHVPETTSEER
ncbi:TetR/AcrR family transcriptional regulator [Isoptericola sp. S6320L]|uniref:TetR/AcrR family transcriptional regulator n=1 Tax=Isoptericola sp. S6320L TaxID=2926411 RepID=UPI001FF25C02|nr:TetR/AcrR family transcriptional regulator [Isoptericola sp. S6320L]MCK0117575.1 TetR/AcrR family transcriptional regulator [Isoptericola sp. S6320L]